MRVSFRGYAGQLAGLMRRDRDRGHKTPGQDRPSHGRHQQHWADHLDRVRGRGAHVVVTGRYWQRGTEVVDRIREGAGVPASSRPISVAGVLHPPTSDGDDGHPGGVMMRGAPGGTSGSSDAIAKAAAVYLASDEAAFVH
jgi:hypothetical protein